MENDLSARIRNRLEALGKSAASASVEAGLGRSAITDILSGNSGSPRLATLEKLTSVLECSLAYLVGATIDPSPTPPGTEDATFDHHDAGGGAKWVNVIEEAKVGVFEDRETARSRIADTKRHYSLFGSVDYPGWHVFGVFVGDTSLTSIGIHYGDIATIAMPPKHAMGQSIPLQDGALVYCQAGIPAAVGFSENSIRLVRRAGSLIHLVGSPSGPDWDTGPAIPSSPTRSLTINIDEISDSDDPNNYDAGSYSVRVRGVVVRIIRDIHPLRLRK
ncbi:MULTISPECIES: helix-turn-helix domain-containing protein [unclassified Rhizobium]|uniref:helix-turn-helix domain-containing protein n=1 Tax=unclassified Rhizobium TaxID=2613769 RepID=UPI00161F2CE1|nr:MULTISPECIES: helix-turn-helix domain-containing protein [unclassified Rhizobium]MBB3385525.1 transcriptional regulator with XRE-family HTH domain [Rhizobium sp. BK098]MBB3617230.1 transcriptional regulator with XRE-family HTH domain [Rhizobium sp. BK609]MBB3682934.1 transcriptional regulator with XRE-family HTH domain [Rhizobium sp. BK612]